MFQYISEILKQFTVKQKMMALIVLVITIIVITLGSTYLKETNKSTSELKEQVAAQRQMISFQQSDINKLGKQVRELNNIILENDMACSDKTLALERSYTEKLLAQQQYVNETIQKVKLLLLKNGNRQYREKLIVKDIEPNDPNQPMVVKAMMEESQIPQENVYQAIGMLDDMQKRIKKKK